MLFFAKNYTSTYIHESTNRRVYTVSQRRERKTTELLPADTISLAGASISSTSVESISVAAMQAASFSHCNCSLTVKQLVLKASIQHCRQNQVLIGSCVFKSLVK